MKFLFSLGLFTCLLLFSSFNSKLSKDIASNSLRAYVPEVKNQNHFANSSAWASVYYAFSTQHNYKRGRKTIVDSTLLPQKYGFYTLPATSYYAFSPFYAYNQVAENPHSGVYLEDILSFIKEEGVPLFSDFDDPKYIPSPDLKDFLKSENRLYKIKRYRKAKQKHKDNLFNYIQKNIDKGRPIIVTFQIDDSFNTLTSTTSIYTPKGKGFQNTHVCVITGYNYNKGLHHVEMVNSWGKTWGDNGYFTMDIKDLEETAINFYTLKM